MASGRNPSHVTNGPMVERYSAGHERTGQRALGLAGRALFRCFAMPGNETVGPVRGTSHPSRFRRLIHRPNPKPSALQVQEGRRIHRLEQGRREARMGPEGRATRNRGTRLAHSGTSGHPARNVFRAPGIRFGRRWAVEVVQLLLRDCPGLHRAAGVGRRVYRGPSGRSGICFDTRTRGAVKRPTDWGQPSFHSRDVS